MTKEDAIKVLSTVENDGLHNSAESPIYDIDYVLGAIKSAVLWMRLDIIKKQGRINGSK